MRTKELVDDIVCTSRIVVQTDSMTRVWLNIRCEVLRGNARKTPLDRLGDRRNRCIAGIEAVYTAEGEIISYGVISFWLH